MLYGAICAAEDIASRGDLRGMGHGRRFSLHSVCMFLPF